MTVYQVPKPNKVCQVEGCNGKFLAKGFCQKHYDQMRMHGYIRDRIVSEPNTFVIDRDICKIGLFDGKGEKSGEAIIDTSDLNLVKNRKWCLDKKGYVVSKKGSVRLHRLITGAKDNQQVDHRGHNKLDNRKARLRICNNSQNQQNTQLRKSNISGAKNVHWFKATQRWQVQVRKDGRTVFAGYFKSFDKAKQAAAIARRKYHGGYACDG